MSEGIIYQEECYQIQGAIFEVYREKGCGFLEAVYQECLEKEFALSSIPFVAQQELQLTYKGQPLRQTYQPDFICYGKIIVELKAVKEIAPEHKAQVINYLKATGFKLALLVNFGSYPKATIIRLAL
jgi:GxxExxY protein